MQDTQSIQSESADLVIGRVLGSYGIKGWLKIFSYTNPIDNIFNYKRWYFDLQDKQLSVRIEDKMVRHKFIAIKIPDCFDRTTADLYKNAVIKVGADNQPQLDDNEIYWHKIQGFDVVSVSDDCVLGRADHFIETGANDVLAVEPFEGSVDCKSRLIPWVSGSVIKDIILSKRVILVDWNADF